MEIHNSKVAEDWTNDSHSDVLLTQILLLNTFEAACKTSVSWKYTFEQARKISAPT